MAEDRIKEILDLLSSKGSVRITELAKKYYVSEMTIRRDLLTLEKKGYLWRTHGGAINTWGRSYEPPLFLNVPLNQNQEKKIKIAQLAASLVQPGDSIALDLGTTNVEIARQLSIKEDITVITPSSQSANILVNSPKIRVILTGGILRPGELSMVGELAESVFSKYFVNKLFLGAACVDIKVGITNFNLDEVRLKKAMISTAKKTILVADSSKFNKKALTKVCSLNEVHCIITDDLLSKDQIEQLQELNIEILVA